MDQQFTQWFFYTANRNVISLMAFMNFEWSFTNEAAAV